MLDDGMDLSVAKALERGHYSARSSEADGMEQVVVADGFQE